MCDSNIAKLAGELTLNFNSSSGSPFISIFSSVEKNPTEVTLTMARDEPASSSDEWSSSNSEDEDDNENPVQQQQQSFQQYSSDEDESSSDDDSADSNPSDDDRSLVDGDAPVRRSEVASSRDDDDDGDGDGDGSRSSSDDERLPLGERLLRKEERQNQAMLQRSKERKRKARKLVSEKLKQLKKDKQAARANSTDEKEQESILKKKRSKHAPTEMSSKRGDFFRQKRTLNESGIGVAIGAHRFKPRDPRVSSLSGTLDQDHFERNYEFVEGIRDKEIVQLKERIAARKLTGNKGNKKRRKLGITGDDSSLEQDVARLRELQQQKAAIERSKMERSAKRSVKKRLQQEVEEGKRSATHFLNRREMKKRVTEAKFEELRKRGGDGAVQKALQKKRKKNKSRDAKKGI